MYEKSKLLNSNDVISVKGLNRFLMEQDTFKVSEVIGKLSNVTGKSKWILEAVECEVLCPGQKWQKGKVKLSIEFCPIEDEPSKESLLENVNENSSASALEEIRRSIE